MVISEPVGGPAVPGALSADFLRRLQPLHEAVTRLPRFRDLCLRSGGAGTDTPCLVLSPLTPWAFDVGGVNTSEVLQTLSAVEVQHPPPAVYTVPTRSVVGSQRLDGSGHLVGAGALQMLFVMSPTADAAGLDAWEAAMLDTVRSWQDPALRLYVSATRSYQDESDRIIAADSPLVGAAIALMFVYVSVVLGGAPPLHSQVSLGATVVLTVGAAMVVGFGGGALGGVPFNVMSQLAIFVLTGVSVDDAFVIAGCFERAPASASLHRRMQAAMREAGPSITLTSLTDFLAFAIGSTIDVPAIAQFCTTAAISVAAVFLFQCTLFAPALVLDTRRQAARRYDVCCCWVAADGQDVPPKQGPAEGAVTAPECVSDGCVGEGDAATDSPGKGTCSTSSFDLVVEEGSVQDQAVELDTESASCGAVEEGLSTPTASEAADEGTPPTGSAGTSEPEADLHSAQDACGARSPGSSASCSGDEAEVSGFADAAVRTATEDSAATDDFVEELDGDSDEVTQVPFTPHSPVPGQGAGAPEKAAAQPASSSASCVAVCVEGNTADGPVELHDDPSKDSLVRQWVRNTYAPFLLQMPVRVGVIVLFLAGAAWGAVNAARIGKGLDANDYLPEKSYLVDFYGARDAHFGNVADTALWVLAAGNTAGLADTSALHRDGYIPPEETDDLQWRRRLQGSARSTGVWTNWAAPQHVRVVERLHERIEEGVPGVSLPLQSWWRAFRLWESGLSNATLTAAHADAVAFGNHVVAWLRTDVSASEFAGDLALVDARSGEAVPVREVLATGTSNSSAASPPVVLGAFQIKGEVSTPSDSEVHVRLMMQMRRAARRLYAGDERQSAAAASGQVTMGPPAIGMAFAYDFLWCVTADPANARCFHPHIAPLAFSLVLHRLERCVGRGGR